MLLINGQEDTSVQTSISGIVDSSTVVANRDGSVMARQEFMIETLLAEPAVRTTQSVAHAVSEGTYGYFSVQLYDINGTPYAVEDIDIASATLTIEKSTGGAAFTTVGVSQSTLAKGLGHIDTSVLFVAIEWAPGDLYRLTISGVTVTNGVTHNLQTFVWNEAVDITSDIDAEVDAILEHITVPAIDNTDDESIADVIGMKGDTPKTSASATIMNNLKSITASSLSKRINISDIPDTTHFATLDLPALGTGGLIGWYALCSLDAGGVGAAPQGEYRLITGWDKPTGVFTHEAFSAPLTTSDKIMIVHHSVYDIILIRPETDKIAGEAIKTTAILNDLEYQHKVYPTLAAGKTIVGSTAWVLGAFVEVIPVNTITSIFTITHVNIGVVSATDTYELVLYSGLAGNEIEIARTRLWRSNNATNGAVVPIQTKPIAANSRISAKVASATNNRNLVISLAYK
jgi:hypothetical protein